MKKKNISKTEKNVKKSIEKKGIAKEAKQLLIVTVSVLLFLGLFYLLTVIILNDDTNNNVQEDVEVQIQFDEVLIGTSFSISDSEYYVLYYETEDEDVNADLASLVSTYRSSNTEPYLYTVDMSNALNSSFISDESNAAASKASELKIAGPTLIKFSDGKIDEYIEGIEDIIETLE